MTAGAEQNGSEAASSDGLVQRVLRWLRAGYPDGVPPQDYLAVLGILQRTLTPTELDRVVDELTADAESSQQLMTRQLVEQRITEIVHGPIAPEDVSRVSARLAAAGWPLGTPLVGASDDDESSSRPGLVSRVVDWLRDGYPSGLPDQDFVPLMALLRRRLSDDEVRLVARRLVEDGVLPSSRADIGTGIVRLTSELPSEADIARVRAYLDQHGWPVDLAV